jgi:hypothetical protein
MGRTKKAVYVCSKIEFSTKEPTGRPIVGLRRDLNVEKHVGLAEEEEGEG